jgi:hypothetical protein
MSILVKNIFRFLLFILVQAYILDQVPPLHQYVKPSLYFLFILWAPFSIPRFWLLILAFIYGLGMDYFTTTPGLHAAACVLIAYIRPFLLNLLLPQDTTEKSYIDPSPGSLGWMPYFVYVLVLTLLHHIYITLIEWLSVGNFIFFIAKVGASTALSLILIFITELLFYRKAKYKTNAA